MRGADIGWKDGRSFGYVSEFLTSGRAESILCAVLPARERGRTERGISEPEMVLPESAHAAATLE